MRESASGRWRLLVERVKSLWQGGNGAEAPLRRPPLQVEELSSRVLPSATLPFVAPAPVAHFGHPAAVQALAGHGQGFFLDNPIHNGAGITYHLFGSARLAGLGQVGVTGTVHSVGFIMQGQASGELTFANLNGSVTVKLEGPQQPGFSPLPQQFNYTVVSGTGQYKNFSGQGSLRLVLQGAPGAQIVPNGTFKLTI